MLYRECRPVLRRRRSLCDKPQTAQSAKTRWNWGKALAHWGLASALLVSAGCNHPRRAVSYLGDADQSYYRGHAQEMDFAAIQTATPDEVVSTAPPRTIRDAEKVPIREITLAEAVHLGLTNSQIIRTGGTFLSPGNALLSAPDRVASVYDPAIQESGVLFGGRGVEAALSAFDAQLNASMIWGRNEVVQNNLFFGGGLQPGNTLVTDTGVFQSGLSKNFSTGGALSVNHSVNYLASSSPGQLFPSSYSGNVNFQYQQPLLAGSGVEFTRIAGPIGQQFGGLTGVSQGVIIARINSDLSLLDFESSVHGLLNDIEDAYWDLYLAYRNYHTAVTSRESTLLTWRIAEIQQEAGTRTRAEVAQARDQYFTAQAFADNAWSSIFTREIQMRRLLGLPVNDGTMLRPADEPVTAELIPDWYSSLTESLTNRVELRRQKWNIKSLELQLRAARSLTRPRLDFIGGYQVNGFGDQLLAYDDDDVAGTQQGLNSYYETITQGNQTGWNMGLQMSMPFGFRSAHAQVRNYEIRLAKANKVIQEQEKEVALELAAAFQEVSRAYAASATNMNRLLAARENVKYLEPSIREGEKLLDDLLRAQARQAEAEVAYYGSLIDYNRALADLQFRKGTLLRHNNIVLQEGGWTPEAYADANHHSEARAHAWPNPLLDTVPEVFASPAPVGGVTYTADSASILAQPQPTIESEGVIEPVPIQQPAPPALPPMDQPQADQPEASVYMPPLAPAVTTTPTETERPAVVTPANHTPTITGSASPAAPSPARSRNLNNK